MYELIKELGEKVKSGALTWEQAAKSFNNQTNLNLTGNALRKRHSNLKEDTATMQNEVSKEEYEMHYANGSVELQKEVWFDENEKKTPESVLKKFGYDPNEWTLQSWRFGKWEVAIKDEATNRVCTTIRAVIKPLLKTELRREEYMAIIKEEMSKAIKPIKLLSKPKQKGLDEDKLFEIPAIELHLGKLAWSGDTGQDYDQHIAQDRFYKIIQEIKYKQDIEKCSRAVLYIGNDFFNSDTVNNTTTAGTSQQNDVRWKKMFNVGLKLYKEAIITLREQFNNIDVKLVQGNHGNMAEFYLYSALQQYFDNDKIINFSNDYKETQCYTFGKCAIFTNHGDPNLKRLMKSISTEFNEEWGKSTFRELHLGHLHKEMVVDDDSGLITRRVGSPSGTDAWHYHERFVGATQKHELFIWHKEYGMTTQYNINFESKKKVLTKEM